MLLTSPGENILFFLALRIHYSVPNNIKLHSNAELREPRPEEVDRWNTAIHESAIHYRMLQEMIISCNGNSSGEFSVWKTMSHRKEQIDDEFETNVRGHILKLSTRMMCLFTKYQSP